MRHLLTSIIILCAVAFAHGQNMVINPGFDQNLTCPLYNGHFNSTTVANWHRGTNAVAQYLHPCYTSIPLHAGSPLNIFGYQMPASSPAYAMIYTYYGGSNYLHTYLKGTMNPLIPGTCYKAELRVSLAEASQYATDGMSVFFYQNGMPVSNNTVFNLNLTPQITYNSGIIWDTTNWVTLIDTFYADSAYTNIIIGNFKTDNNTQIASTNFPSFTQGGWVYQITGAGYYIDNVVVEPFIYPPMAATSTQVNNICYGGASGTATVTPTGGVPPYSYLWSNGQTAQTATGLAAGTYTCTITDALNGTYVHTVTITQPPISIIASISSVTTATCGQQNGSATVSVTGGVPLYQYQWLPTGGSNATANNLGGGTYTCTVVDANGCLDTAVAIVGQSSAFTLSTTASNAACFGTNTGSATVTPSGGTQPFTYLWNNGQTTQTATNLVAGIYSVTVTDANGCTGTATVTITQPTQLTASISSSTNINCNGQNTGSAIAIASGGTPGYSYLWSNGQTTQTATGLAAGTYTVTVTDTKGCTATATVTITQPPLLNLNIVSTTNASCGQNNGTATVVASGGTPGYTYQWLPTGGTGTTATGLGAGIYTVTVTDSKGCIKTVNITITTSTPLNVNISSSTDINCYGQNNGSASVSVSGGTQPYTYNWSNGGTTASVSNLIAGTYSVVVTDINGCAGSATVTITQPSQLNASVPAITYVGCYGQNTGSATVSASGGTPGYSYLWSNGQTTQTATWLSAGTYTCTITDAHGCTDTAQATITQPTAVSLVISTANATCSQNNGWATATVSGGTQPYTYSWSNGPMTQTISNLGAGTYTCTITDANGCTASATVGITQSASLTLNIASGNISCHEMNNGSATVAVSTGTPPYTYSWSNGGTTASISNLSAGTYTITVTDAIGCQGTNTATITEPTVLTASIINNADVLCNGDATGIAEVTATGGTTPYSYLWSNAGAIALQNTLIAGTYTVIVTDSNGCNDSASVTISEPAAIIVSAQSLTSSCIGQSQGSAMTTATGGIPPYNYSWNSNPLQTTTTATGLAPGNYTVTVTDSNGCTATASVAITAFPQLIVDAGEDSTYCPGKDTLTLNASGAASYAWSPATGLSCSNCANPFAYPSATTTYILTGTDANGCTATDDVTISVMVKGPTSVGATEDICGGESTQLYADGGIQYWWSPIDGMNDNTIAEPTVSPRQSTEYTVIIKQNDCFTDTLTQSVVVHSMPTVSLGPDIKSVAGASVELHADTTDAISITWTPPFNLDCDNCLNPIAFIEKDIRYVATVSNGGCTAVDDINIRISCSESDIFLPNSFTPNDDGNNDYFYPQCAYTLPIAYMAIYDRWGEKIFEKENFKSNDPASGWNGTYKGKVLDPNVFVYYLQFYCGNGQKVLVKGDITIVK